jgi:hypothetical protein
MIQTKDSTVQSDFHIVPITRSEFVLWPTLLTSNKPQLTISHTLMSKDLRLSTRIRQKLKNGAKSTIFFWHLIQSPSKSPNFWVTSWSSWVSSQLPSLKEKSFSPRSTKLSTPSSSNQRRPHASVLPSETSRLEKKTSDKTSPWPLTSWSL